MELRRLLLFCVRRSVMYGINNVTYIFNSDIFRNLLSYLVKSKASIKGLFCENNYKQAGFMFTLFDWARI